MLRVLVFIFTLPVLFLVTYAGLGFGLGAVAFSPGTPRPSADAARSVPIFVLSNGYHASLILPLRATGWDWAARFPPGDFAAAPPDATHVMLAWGERDFYMNTRTLADLDLGLMARAALGLGGAVMHVALVGEPRPGPRLRAIALSPAGYRALARFVESSFARDESGGIRLHPGMGYGPHDAFYEGTGRYTLLMTCNEWVGRALRAGGVPVGLWTPFASSLLREPYRF